MNNLPTQIALPLNSAEKVGRSKVVRVLATFNTTTGNMLFLQLKYHCLYNLTLYYIVNYENQKVYTVVLDLS